MHWILLPPGYLGGDILVGNGDILTPNGGFRAILLMKCANSMCSLPVVALGNHDHPKTN